MGDGYRFEQFERLELQPLSAVNAAGLGTVAI
jgi:hypothetical protein